MIMIGQTKCPPLHDSYFKNANRQIDNGVLSKVFRDEIATEIRNIAYDKDYVSFYDFGDKRNIVLNIICSSIKGSSYNKLKKSYKDYVDLNSFIKEIGMADKIKLKYLYSSAEMYIISLGIDEEILAKFKINLS